MSRPWSTSFSPWQRSSFKASGFLIARRRGLTIPQIVASSGVPTASVHRIIKEFRGAELIIVVGKDGKAPVYGLNPCSRAAVETARSLMDHARRIAAIKAGSTEHGGVTLAGEPTMVTVELTTKRDAGQRKKPRVSVDLEA